MSEQVTLPELGESVTEGTISRILKQVGDTVEFEEALLEVSTDKVDTEIPSPIAGVIEAILVNEGDEVEPGALLMTIGDGSGAAAPAPVAAAPVVAPVPVAAAPVAAAPVAAAPVAAAPAAAAPAAPAATPEALSLRGTTVPMSRLRKVIVKRSVESMVSTAQVTSVVEADITRIAQLRDLVKDEFFRRTGNKLSFLPFFAVAAVETLRVHPIINARVEGESIVYPDKEHLSIGVDTERGLMAPVIKDAGDLNIAMFTERITDLAERTRASQLKPDELAGGTFTLTNTGSRGSLFDTPIVFLPQSAILGTGKVVKRAVVIPVDGEDSIMVRSMVYLALSYDHRIIDGADAARFLGTLKERLEGGDFAAKLGI